MPRRPLPPALLRCQRPHLLHKARLAGRDALLHGVLHPQRQLQAEQVLLPPIARQARCELLLDPLAATPAQPRQCPRFPLPAHKRLHNRHPGLARDVAHRPVHLHCRGRLAGSVSEHGEQGALDIEALAARAEGLIDGAGDAGVLPKMLLDMCARIVRAGY